MRTVIAYTLTLILGQFVFSLVIMILGVLIAYLLIFLSANTRVRIVMPLVAIISSFITITFAYYLFMWLTGSFGVLAFLAAALSMGPPLMTEYNKYKGMKAVRDESEVIVKELASPITTAQGLEVIGMIVGTVAGGIWYLIR